MNERLCVFCGSSAGNDPRFRAIARETGEAIVRAGYGIVYGGGSIGLMGVLADAALALGGEVIGVIPEALATAEIAHPGLTRLDVVDSMHRRKAVMAEQSAGFIALPGGYGTMDEFCEILTWRQLGLHDKPIGLLNPIGYFDGLLNLFGEMVEYEFVSHRHRDLFVSATSIGALLEAMFRNDTA